MTRESSDRRLPRSDLLFASIGLVAVLAAADWHWHVVDWPKLGSWAWRQGPAALLVAPQGPPALLAITGGVVLLIGAGRALLHRLRPDQPELALQRQPIRSIRWWMVLAAVAAVVTATWLAMQWLLEAAKQAKDPGTAQLDAIRTALTVGAGTGGAVALLLTARKQWLGERTQAHTEDDATERRITELYTKAVEQLGSTKAPVRLGGLYALERLAQNNPAHRQTIVDVICAYLRMPFTPAQGAARRLGLPRPVRPGAKRSLTSHVPVTPTSGTAASNAEREELQVRLTAQDILTRHLRPGTHRRRRLVTFWSDIDLKLTNATLTDLDLHGCQVRTGTFISTHFLGTAEFRNARFGGTATFGKARFDGDARFDQAHFDEDARFDEAHFEEDAQFDLARFTKVAQFDKAQFGWTAWFSGARFRGTAWFSEAQFSWTAWFSGARFRGTAWFRQARFGGEARYSNVRFGGDTWFGDTRFGGDATFGGARFGRGTWLGEARFVDARARLDITDGVVREFPAGWTVTPAATGQDSHLPDDDGVWGYLTTESTRHAGENSPLSTPATNLLHRKTMSR